MKAVRVIVTGRGQGGWYRAITRDAAHRIGGVAGWARNLPDGTVEIVAQGEASRVDELMEWASHGPPQAHVTDLRIEELSEELEIDGFEVRY